MSNKIEAARELIEAVAKEMDRLGYGHHESHAESILHVIQAAAQHQGEPVAEIRRAALGCIDWISWPSDLPDGTKLYAEQPAPVAVVLLGLDVFKALEKVRGAPVLTTNQCYDLARLLNACLDKVKELNP